MVVWKKVSFFFLFSFLFFVFSSSSSSIHSLSLYLLVRLLTMASGSPITNGDIASAPHSPPSAPQPNAEEPLYPMLTPIAAPHHERDMWKMPTYPQLILGGLNVLVFLIVLWQLSDGSSPRAPQYHVHAVGNSR